MYKKILIFCLLCPLLSFSSWRDAEKTYDSRLSNSQLRNIVIELVKDNYVFSALPWMKEYLIKDTKQLDRRIDSALSHMISVAGTKQFETLPLKFLKRSKSDNMRFIIAKKYLRDNDYSRALNYLENISSSHEVFPYAVHMQATIYTIIGETKKANRLFDRCKSASESQISRNPKSRKLKMNRDYCLAGKARAEFKDRDFDQSDLLYLDIPKSSPVWPEILFEEAWNSYYQKNYNRSLGKLVSYKAPVFNHMFNPEIDVLRALSYMKLCLYSDAKSVVQEFYEKYYNDAKSLRLYLLRHKREINHFYNSMMNYESRSKSENSLHALMLKSVLNEEAFIDLKRQFVSASKEYDKLRNKPNSRFKRATVLNLQEAILTQKRILGAFVKQRLLYHYATLSKAFEGMSYINLEVLSQRKAKLYSFDEKNRTRGDIKYIERNEKQYFWDFNGEFWADELGDYVFALRSEC